MEINNEELQEDLKEQYAMLEEEVQEDKKRKRYLILFIFFFIMFLITFGTTFSYFKIYKDNKEQIEDVLIKDLYVEHYEDAFEFDSKIHSYALTVPSNTKMVNVKYVLGCQKCKVSIKGNDDLKPGSNEVDVIITKEDGEEVIYIIYVIVEEDEEDPIQDKPTNNKPSNPNNNNNNDNKNDDNNDNNDNKNDNNHPGEVKVKNLDLIYLNVTNHKLNDKFVPSKTAYIVNDIMNNEDTIEVNFELADKTNKFIIKLNDIEISRKPDEINGVNNLKINVKTELVLGANKLEIIVKDDEGNEKIYYLFLIVNEVNTEDPKVIEITVEYDNGNESYNISNIIPGWVSSERQNIKITNNSNYDVNININWTNVSNSFVNKNDLIYTLYKNNNVIKTDILPSVDSTLASNLKIAANSSNDYYIGYKYIYSVNDQNADQGKTFNAKISVSLSK